jgi:molybdopterin/thiamine biosynthesis adenylyltransferase
MTGTLVLTEEIASEVGDVARQPLETAGVLLCSIVLPPDGGVRLLSRRLIWLDDSAYDRRASFELAINAVGYTRPLALAEELAAVPIWIHTHPGINSSPDPSQHDVLVDEGIAEAFRIRSGSAYYGAAIFSPTDKGISFTGHVNDGERTTLLTKLWIVGNRLRLISRYGETDTLDHTAFDRNIRAFGGEIQRALGKLHAGVIGVGGTGSAVAEQLVRLGVRRFTLIDPDEVSASNLSRLYGSTPADVGRPKVNVVADHLQSIAPGTECNAIRSSINIKRTAMLLASCDIVFGCTDDNAGRVILSRLPTFLLTPVIDCGVLLTSAVGGLLTGIDGRVTTILPGTACLICRDRIDLRRAAAELMTPEERVRRQDEGYAPALGGREASVVAFTTMVGAMAVCEMLERMVGYGPEPRPTEILQRFHEREMSTNIATSRPKHYCAPASGMMGFGASEPFLGLTWAS